MNIRHPFIPLLALFGLATASCSPSAGIGRQATVLAEDAQAAVRRDVPYVPTHQSVVNRMLQMGQVGEGDLLYDLGCGDGRIVITAARDYGARGVGVDIDPRRIRESNANAREAGVTDRVRFYQRDLFQVDLQDADVVTLYLLPSVNLRLRPKLLNELRPGTRVVSHDFHMEDWEPDQSVEVKSPTRTHNLYMWIIPADAEGAWQGRNGAGLQLDQNFQKVEGRVRINGREIPISEGELEGRTLRFTAVPGASGTPEMLRFEGVVNGSEIRGTLHRQGGANPGTQEWVLRKG